MTIRYAYLVPEEYTWSGAMLNHLPGTGMLPGCIIRKTSEVSEVEREELITRTAGQPTSIKHKGYKPEPTLLNCSFFVDKVA
ncbi:MAG: hypothetical protein HPY76_09050 [Anaerolineae bacterium]|jgi:hypothetical protein|nr:hypothetical protein [Anaerolineae bacterium]